MNAVSVASNFIVFEGKTKYILDHPTTRKYAKDILDALSVRDRWRKIRKPFSNVIHVCYSTNINKNSYRMCPIRLFQIKVAYITLYEYFFIMKSYISSLFFVLCWLIFCILSVFTQETSICMYVDIVCEHRGDIVCDLYFCFDTLHSMWFIHNFALCSFLAFRYKSSLCRYFIVSDHGTAEQ